MGSAIMHMGNSDTAEGKRGAKELGASSHGDALRARFLGLAVAGRGRAVTACPGLSATSSQQQGNSKNLLSQQRLSRDKAGL